MPIFQDSTASLKAPREAHTTFSTTHSPVSTNFSQSMFTMLSCIRHTQAQQSAIGYVLSNSVILASSTLIVWEALPILSFMTGWRSMVYCMESHQLYTVIRKALWTNLGVYAASGLCFALWRCLIPSKNSTRSSRYL